MTGPYCFISGLDLGQTTNPAALVVTEKCTQTTKPVYTVRHIERYPLGTDYIQAPGGAPGIGEQVRDLMRRPPLPGSMLGVDETGVGRPVMNILRSLEIPCWLRPITSTNGHQPKQEPDGSLHVPKKDMVGALLVVLQGRRIAIAELPARDPPPGVRGARRGELTQQLRRELSEFRIRITKKAQPTETFGAESGAYDDLVCALMIAVWLGERGPGATTELRSGGGHVQPPADAFGRPAKDAPRGTFGHGDRPSRGLGARW